MINPEFRVERLKGYIPYDVLACVPKNKNEKGSVRRAAAVALGEHFHMRDCVAVHPDVVVLTSLLKNAKNKAFKEALTYSVSMIRKNQIMLSNESITEAAPYDVQNPDFLESSELEAMLWREPNKPVSEYMATLADKDFLVWENAREELIGFGAGGAAKILEIMAAAPAIVPGKVYQGYDRPLRWKLEGVLSRICRDGRNSEMIGTLDVGTVQKYLFDSCPYIRDIAAELIVSCAPKRQALPIILKGMKNTIACTSCVRAAGLAGFREFIRPLVAIVSDTDALLQHRVDAARYLAHLKPEKAGKQLLAVLKSTKDLALQRELIWALSLMGMKEAEDEIAKYLDDKNENFIRIRAIIALVVLKSDKIGRVESWLADNDRAILEIGCWALSKTHKKKEMQKIIRKYIGKQKNKELKNALKYQLKKEFYLKW